MWKVQSTTETRERFDAKNNNDDSNLFGQLLNLCPHFKVLKIPLLKIGPFFRKSVYLVLLLKKFWRQHVQYYAISIMSSSGTLKLRTYETVLRGELDLE